MKWTRTVSEEDEETYRAITDHGVYEIKVLYGHSRLIIHDRNLNFVYPDMLLHDIMEIVRVVDAVLEHVGKEE